ncbi:MAG: PASTA domain-containing protein [Acidobacteriota bacterium]
MWRRLVRLLRALLYLGVLGVIFAVVSYLAFSQFVRRGVTPTPELFGLVEEDARALLGDQGLRLEIDTDERYHEEVPAGHVMLQRPRAGTLVKRGGAVTVVRSRGPRRIIVPPVTGEALQAAQVTLAAAGLTVGRSLAIHGEADAGAIVAQRPAPGERMEQNGPVDVFMAVEDGGETYVMPDLVGRSYDQVRVFFVDRGFRLGRVGYERYPGLVPGTVLRQYPLAGHPLRRGDVIALDLAAAAGTIR